MPSQHHPLVSSLTELRDIFLSYNRKDQAATVSRLINSRVCDASRFEQELASDEIWSGPHAIWQVTLYESAAHPLDVVKADERRFRDVIIRLVEAMDSEGIRNELAEKVAKRFTTWNALGRGV